MIASPPSMETLVKLLQGALPESDALAVLRQLSPDDLDEATFSTLYDLLWAKRPDVNTAELPVMDCCGTGGSGQPHYNTSTTVAFVLAAAGVPVVKFGNRAASSTSGSFDFLEALGIPAGIPPEHVAEILSACGCAFLFAPVCYPQLAPLAPLRRHLWQAEKQRTVFNYLGPLLNPAAPAFRLLGVSHERMQPVIAAMLARQPHNRLSWVVRGGKTLDELSTRADSAGLAVRRGDATNEAFTINPPDGARNATPTARTYSPSENVAIFNALIHGDTGNVCPDEKKMVLLNAAAGLHVAGLAEDLTTGRRIAESLLAGGQVAATVARCLKTYEKYAS
ncbi:MAG: anthranilate phosphoribosyltransferase [Candidatus Melainabacteria bacterium]